MVEKYTSLKFEAILGRIKEETGIKSVRQLAEIIGKNHTTILAAKAKDNFPANWAFEIEKKYGLLTRWVMTGEGPKRLSEGVELNPLLKDVNEWLNEGKKHESAEFRQLFRSQMIRAFFDYEDWRRKRDQQESGEYTGSTRKVA